MAHDVFISYATGNKAIADATCVALEVRGIRSWIAPRDVRPGSSYAVAISEAIATARVTVVVLSGDANRSPHVRKEALLAFKAGAHIIPLRVEDVYPQGGLEYVLEGEHWLDAMTPPLEAHLRTLADTISAVLKLPPSAPPPVRAPSGEAKRESDRPRTDANVSWIPTHIPVRHPAVLAVVTLGLIGLAGLAVLIPALQRTGATEPPSSQSPTVGQSASPSPTPPGSVKVPSESALGTERRAAQLGVWVAAEPGRTHVPGKGDITGARIAQVLAGSSAERAGLRPDDIVTALGGQRVPDGDALVEVIASGSTGSSIAIDFVRQNQIRQVNAVLRGPDEGVSPTPPETQTATQAGREGTTSARPKPRYEMTEPAQMSVAGEWDYRVSTEAADGSTCTQNAVLRLEGAVDRLSGSVRGTVTCSTGYMEKSSDVLEGIEIIGTKITFGNGRCRYQGTISGNGSRITGDVRCGRFPQSWGGNWQAVRR